MSDSEEKKPTTKLEVVSMMSKITEDKLTGLNYLEWSKTIRIYVRSVRMGGHLTKDLPIDDSKEQWMEEDARLFIQIRNSIDSKVPSLVNHCEFVKELMDYLEFVFSGKGNVSRIFDMCKAFYRLQKQDQSLTEFLWPTKRYMKSLICLYPLVQMSKFSRVNENRWQLWDFLQYDSAKAQILSSLEISSLQETYSRILCIEVSSSSSPILLSAQTSCDLIRQTIESERQRNRNSGPGDNTRGPGHVIRDCKKR